MCEYPFSISLNAFEIIINYGININIENEYDDLVIHELLHNQCDNHVNNILNLLVKCGINLNIINYDGITVLDLLTYYQHELNEETKNCIMTIIDFGGTTNEPNGGNAIYDFIEYYKYSSIKPAIKK